MAKRMKRTRPAGWILRCETAQRYFPDSSKQASVSRLNRWIVSDPQLLRDLQKRGYRSGTHYLSPGIVEVMDRYLG